MSTTDHVFVTHHALTRWSERSDLAQDDDDDNDDAISTAWEHAMEISEPHHFDADEVRYHHDARVFLLRKRQNIVTIVDRVDAHPSQIRALERAKTER